MAKNLIDHPRSLRLFITLLLFLSITFILYTWIGQFFSPPSISKHIAHRTPFSIPSSALTNNISKQDSNDYITSTLNPSINPSRNAISISNANILNSFWPTNKEGVLCKVPTPIIPYNSTYKWEPAKPTTCEDHPNFSYFLPSDNSILYFNMSLCPGRIYVQKHNGLSTVEVPVFSNSLIVDDSEQLVAECKYSQHNSFYNYHLRLKQNTLITERLKLFSTRQKSTLSLRSQKEKPLNILLIYLDSLSRAEFMRGMPLTRDWFKEINTEKSRSFTVYDFDKFNVVGSGTYENFPPITSGRSYADFKVINNEKQENILVWDYLEDLGYISNYIEEGCIHNTGSAVRLMYGKASGEISASEIKKFKRTAAKMADHVLYNIFCDFMQSLGIGDFFSKSSRKGLCFGGKYVHQHIFNYNRRFSYLLLVEPHEGSAQRVGTIDSDLRDFLSEMMSLYPQTAVVLLGDHGLDHLVTGYDVFETLLHLATLSVNFSPNVFNYKPQSKYGHSLFTSIDPSRTCNTANIQMNYCSCSTYSRIDNLNQPNVVFTTYAALNYLQNLTAISRNSQSTSSCALLELDHILEAQIVTTPEKPKDSVKKKIDNSAIQISFQTKPAGSLNTIEKWEALVQHHELGKYIGHCKTLRIGTRWVPSRKIFEGHEFILPDYPETIWAVDYWNEHEKTIDYHFEWVAPSNKVYYQTNITLDAAWVIAWQPLVLKEPLPQGEWSLKITNQDGKLTCQQKFYILDKKYFPIDNTTFSFSLQQIKEISKFYEVKELKRTSEYEKHHHCVPQNVQLQYCVC